MHLIAPARRAFAYGHIPDGDSRTRCGEDTTDPAELWQPGPPGLAGRVCPACSTPNTIEESQLL
ncbi:hypothetical protein [Sphaerisporangium sp. NPDC051011]|uniref:hypothetical protein n=1 Tax=Sphaerisporangium sp. NPDC051011 TaxID=3155792 RepID=UPI0033E7E056